MEPTVGGVEYVGPLTALMQEGYTRELAQAALASAGNDMSAARTILVDSQARSTASFSSMMTWWHKPAMPQNVAGVVLESYDAPGYQTRHIDV